MLDPAARDRGHCLQRPQNQAQPLTGSRLGATI